MKKRRGLKIGVIGTGAMGQNHCRVCATLPGAVLAAVADSDAGRAAEIAAKYNVPAFSNYQEMLPLVEAVIVATPTGTHFEIASACLNAGKNILVEKPLAANSEQASALVRLAEEKKLTLATGFIERFNPAFQELCRLVRKEKVLGINIKRFSPFPQRITDASVIQDMMIHDLDLLVNLLPADEIEGMKAEGCKIKSNKLDRVSATFFFRSGVISKIDADRDFSIKTRKITVVSERGLIEADLLNKKVYIRDLVHHIPSVHHTKDADQLTLELMDFVKAIASGKKPTVDGHAGYRALKLAEEVLAACS
jgi:predicted dehydrogenase